MLRDRSLTGRGFTTLAITDGTSNTILIAERSFLRSPQTTWVGCVTGAEVPQIDPTLLGDAEEGHILCMTNTSDASENRLPNRRGGVFHVEDASSMHSGGINIALADGSVRFLRDNININTWVALGTRNGGEVVNLD
jgi:prepilin-type processing-associated H-X9-DG protein